MTDETNWENSMASTVNHEIAGRQAQKFTEYCETVDFGRLNDVRAYVIMHCLDNCSDVDCEDVYEVAKSTLESYLDDDSQDEVWNDYRASGIGIHD